MDLFHGTREENIESIVMDGFNTSLSRGGLCGRGIYFADNTVKSDEFVFKEPGGKAFQGCSLHDDYYCSECDRYVILSSVMLGHCLEIYNPMPKQQSGLAFGYNRLVPIYVILAPSV